MKLELKENMHVRTKDGYISQYKYYDYDIGEGLIGKLLCIPLNNGTFANIENIKKFSYNIIDILEEGDYVNGYKVTRIGGTYHGRKDRAIYCDYQENEKTGKWIMIYDDEIKSIVTHDQMEQMAYRVEE